MKIFKIIAGIVCFIILIIGLTLGAGMLEIGGTWLTNRINYTQQRVDDVTNYDTIRRVEDTARSMIANYKADKLMWEQYKDSDNPEHQSWASQARTRANRTATSYNEFFRQNSFVWGVNIPSDIDHELEIIR